MDLPCRGGCCRFVDGELLPGRELLGVQLLHGVVASCGGEGSSPSTHVRKFSCQPRCHFTSVRSHAHELGFRVYTLDLVSHPPLAPVLLMFDRFRSSLTAHFLFVAQTKLIHSPTPRYTIPALVALATFASCSAYVYLRDKRAPEEATEEAPEEAHEASPDDKTGMLQWLLLPVQVTFSSINYLPCHPRLLGSGMPCYY